MEKLKIQATDRTTGEKGEEIEIYDSLSASRLEFETREEYIHRRAFIKQIEKQKKKRVNLTHVSSNLIPLTDKEGKVIIIDKKPIWIGKTKGVTFKKQIENEE